MKVVARYSVTHLNIPPPKKLKSFLLKNKTKHVNIHYLKFSAEILLATPRNSKCETTSSSPFTILLGKLYHHLARGDPMVSRIIGVKVGLHLGRKGTDADFLKKSLVDPFVPKMGLQKTRFFSRK